MFLLLLCLPHSFQSWVLVDYLPVSISLTSGLQTDLWAKTQTFFLSRIPSGLIQQTQTRFTLFSSNFLSSFNFFSASSHSSHTSLYAGGSSWYTRCSTMKPNHWPVTNTKSTKHWKPIFFKPYLSFAQLVQSQGWCKMLSFHKVFTNNIRCGH